MTDAQVVTRRDFTMGVIVSLGGFGGIVQMNFRSPSAQAGAYAVFEHLQARLVNLWLSNTHIFPAEWRDGVYTLGVTSPLLGTMDHSGSHAIRWAPEVCVEHVNNLPGGIDTWRPVADVFMSSWRASRQAM